ncbi:D-glycerate dehydrogenase [bacterium]|nr:D-glycerate dehydrogenase [bacterium]
MSRPVVLVTAIIPEKGITLLEQTCSVRLDRVRSSLSYQDIKARVGEADALLCLLADRIDRELIDAGPRLKIIANYAVGYDNIDVSYATAKGIMVSNTPGVLTEATAELAWALIFSVCRQIVPADRFLRQGRFTGWGPLLFLGYGLSGKTLGIIGMGRIGQAVARMATGFRMQVLYSDKTEIRPVPGLQVRYVTLEELAREADIISVHTPLTDQTRHLCNHRFFSQCKKTAVFVNTSRGPVVDEEALVAALEHKMIAGAGLDVYEREPLVHPELLNKENVVLLPHIGSATFETRENMAILAATSILEAMAGQTPHNLVNPEVVRGY